MEATLGQIDIFGDGVITLENGTTHAVQVLTVKDKLGNDEEVAYCFDVNAAALIVRAVNCHADLLAALENMMSEVGYDQSDDTLRQADAAIAKAKGAL